MYLSCVGIVLTSTQYQITGIIITHSYNVIRVIHVRIHLRKRAHLPEYYHVQNSVLPYYVTLLTQRCTKPKK